MRLAPGSRRTSTEVSVVVSKHLIIGVQVLGDFYE